MTLQQLQFMGSYDTFKTNLDIIRVDYTRFHVIENANDFTIHILFNNRLEAIARISEIEMFLIVIFGKSAYMQLREDKIIILVSKPAKISLCDLKELGKHRTDYLLSNPN